jgi:hypothetical protein
MDEPNNLITVFSWNICWGCMSQDANSSKDKSAMPLSKYCQDTSKCLENVYNFIKINNTDNQFDFICLQEATKWLNIYNQIQNGIYKYISYNIYDNSTNIEIVTFYNSRKYELIGVSYGNIENICNDRRPCLISFFKIKTNSKIICVINLHNKHNFTKKNLALRINNFIEKITVFDNIEIYDGICIKSFNSNNKDCKKIDCIEDNCDVIESSIATTLSVTPDIIFGNNVTSNNIIPNIISLSSNTEAETEAEAEASAKYSASTIFNNLYTIVAGDFNDKTTNYWYNLYIFRDNINFNLKDIFVNNLKFNIEKPEFPPKTCCDSLKSDKGYNLYGDYILADLNKFEVIKSTSLFKSNPHKLTSDHLPVYAAFKISDSVSETVTVRQPLTRQSSVKKKDRNDLQNKQNNTTPDVNMIRSIVYRENGCTLITAVDEIFKGRMEYFEIKGHPSTIILPNTNVIIASQIYLREFYNQVTKEIYTKENLKTYDDYYNIKHNKLPDKEKYKITWLGCPSIIFNYNNRNLLNVDKCNAAPDIFFNLSSFNSTTCIKEFTNIINLTDDNIDQFYTLEQLCKDPIKYNKHYSFQGNSTFKTNFDDIQQDIKLEQNKADEFYKKLDIRNTHGLQRYNETFSYFYPWDIVGIEVGAFDTSIYLLLKDIIEIKIKNFIDGINIILNDNIAFELFHHIYANNTNIHFKKEKFIDDITNILSLINHDNDNNNLIKQLNLSESNDIFYLLKKYIYSSSGISTIEKDTVRKILNQINYVLNSQKNIKLFEYKYNETTKFYELVELTNNERTSHFYLYEQTQYDINNINDITILNQSEFQLSKNNNGLVNTEYNAFPKINSLIQQFKEKQKSYYMNEQNVINYTQQDELQHTNDHQIIDQPVELQHTSDHQITGQQVQLQHTNDQIIGQQTHNQQQSQLGGQYKHKYLQFKTNLKNI